MGGCGLGKKKSMSGWDKRRGNLLTRLVPVQRLGEIDSCGQNCLEVCVACLRDARSWGGRSDSCEQRQRARVLAPH